LAERRPREAAAFLGGAGALSEWSSAHRIAPGNGGHMTVEMSRTRTRCRQLVRERGRRRIAEETGGRKDLPPAAHLEDGIGSFGSRLIVAIQIRGLSAKYRYSNFYKPPWIWNFYGQARQRPARGRRCAMLQAPPLHAVAWRRTLELCDDGGSGALQAGCALR
jgi:hypothetical protein